MPRSVGWIRLALVVTACGVLLRLAGPTSGGQPQAAGDSDIIPGRYIVLLKGPGSPHAVTARLGLEPRVVYEHGLWGFAGNFSDKAIRRLRADPAVLSIEPDRVVTLDDQTLPTGIDRADADLSTVAMIDGVDDALDVDIAIIDTGIQPGNPDLRVAGGVALLGSDCTGSSWADARGHGTHVAGTAAAIDNSIGVVGVAPGARLWSVRVFDDDGNAWLSCIIAGVDWVTANAATIEVANMSLKSDPSTAFCQAIASSAAAGVVYSVSAGNSHTDASLQSPANCADVLTVSAIADFDGLPGGLDPQSYNGSCFMHGDDMFACFSNYGPLVEIAAPGVQILSTGMYGQPVAMSGTSMAAPHVTGAAALDIVEHGKPTDAAGAAAVRARVVAGGVSQDGPSGFTGDPDSYHEPLLSVALPGAYDAAVTGVTTPVVIVPAELAQIDVALSFNGTSSQTLSLTLAASGGAVLDSPQTVIMQPHSTAVVPFTWDTTGVLPGDYSLTGTVSGPPGDIKASNGAFPTTATVRAAEHNIAVTELAVRSAVLEESPVPVQVTATNPGTFSETFSVVLSASGGSIEGSPQEVTLAPTESTTLSFTWHTPLASANPYSLAVTAGPVPGEESTSDNSRAVDVLVTELQVIVVNSSADSNDVCDATECTIREAIASANAVPGPARIDFSIPPGGRQTIAPLNALPDITDAVTIDGTTQPGFAGTPIIELSGGVIGGEADGLRILGGESTVRGLVVNGFRGDGIELGGQGRNVIQGNFVGLDTTGYAILKNTGDGVKISGSSSNMIGGTTAAERNVLSGNDGKGVGIYLDSSEGNIIQGNYLGTSGEGLADLGNRTGVGIENGDANLIGGTAPGAGNVMGGNDVGVSFFGCYPDEAQGNVVQGNLIGTDVSGTVALGGGIGEQCGADNVIGGTAPEAGNLISGGGGITINASSRTVIQGNRIGTDITGRTVLGNPAGITLHYTSDVVIGGAAPGARNIVSGNAGYGIEIYPENSGTVVQGNYIGTNITGTIALGNGGAGIHVNGSPGTIIGGSAPGAGNIISANGGDGIVISEDVRNSLGSVIKGNVIGTDVTDTVPLGNARDGIRIWSWNIPVGGTASGEANIIAYNGEHGVYVGTSRCTGNTIRGNSIHSNTGLGIENYSRGNLELAPPVVAAGGAGGISGMACAGCAVDVYSDDADEGRIYDGSTQADDAGAWSLPAAPEGPCVTAVATDPYGNTSEFSWPFAVYGGDCPAPPPWVIFTPLEQDRFGASLALGDVNGDGTLDIAVGATSSPPSTQGRADVFSVVDRSQLLTLNNPHPQQSAWFGYSVALGDVNGDGRADIAVGGPWIDVDGNADQGRAYVFSGADSSLLFTLDTPSAQTKADFGWSVGVGDVNGDGRADVAVGARRQDVGGKVGQGRVYVFSGADGSLLFTVDSPNPQASAYFGRSMAMGDVNGDGRPDIAVGAEQDRVGGTPQGRAYVFSGVDGSVLFSLDTPNPQSSGHFGASIAVGEVDGDGKQDIAVGADQERVGDIAFQGRAYVFSGADGSLLLSLDSPNPQYQAHFGRSVGVGDVNGDGTLDIAVGADSEDVAGDAYQGRAYVFSGADGSLLFPLDTTRPEYGSEFGFSVALGYISHDGRADVVVGEPGGGSPSVHVFISGPGGPEPTPTPTPTPTLTPTPSPTPTPTPSPTPIPTPPPDPPGGAVGGIAVLPDVAEHGSSSFDWVAIAAVAGTIVVTLTVGAWYARRRWLG